MTSAQPVFHFKVVMPSDPRYLPVVRGVVCPLAAAIGWDEADCGAITLALDEALTNVIRHAYHGRADGVIELECKQSGDELEVTLWDQGEPPDMSKICALERGCLEPGGLGTHIIKDVMDTVSYQALPRGNRFLGVKRLRKTI